MKAIFSLILLIASVFNTFATEVEKPKAPILLSNQVRFTPVIVYGTLSDCNNDLVAGVTEANITIYDVIKGVLEEQKIAIRFNNIHRSKYHYLNKTNHRNGETKIFFLSKNTAGSWQVSSELDINGNRIKTPSNPTISDFKAGVALFESQYTYFQEKKANNMTITLENPTKNQTFAFLAKEMMGDLLVLPEKTVKSNENNVKKRKKAGKKRKK